MVRDRVVSAAILLFGVLAACGTPSPSGVERHARISFLTRDGCANTPVMRERLDAALAATGTSATLIVIDLADLDADDALTGYGAPTILVGGRDLFGAPTPRPAPPV